MKSFIIVFGILLLQLSQICVSSVGAAEQMRHLFILSGQSNMARLDPNVSFAPAVEKAFGKENVTVVKDALGGQPILRWYKKWKPPSSLGLEQPAVTGDLYDQLMDKVNHVLAEHKFASITFVWMQGERDARLKYGDVYANSLKGLIQQLSQDLGNREINFVIGRLSDFDMENKRYPHWTLVREAQVEIAENDPRGSWVNTDDLNDGLNEKGRLVRNDLHYTTEGYREFGTRLANACILLVQHHHFSQNNDS